MEEVDTLTIKIDAGDMKEELADIEASARSVSRLLSKVIAKAEKAEGLVELNHNDMVQEMRRFVARVCRDEDATPAELEAMAEVAQLVLIDA